VLHHAQTAGYVINMFYALFTEFTFKIDDVAFCNTRRPRQQSNIVHVEIVYAYNGNAKKNSPEGFSAIVSLPRKEEYQGPTIVMHGKDITFYTVITASGVRINYSIYSLP